MNKKICVVTGTRAEYGLFLPIMKKIQSSSCLKLQIVATTMHFSEEFGNTYKQIEKDGFFIVFGDASNGRETYPPGRFLITPAPRQRKVVLDFNRAYNPPCALTTYATCPYPPSQNRLDFAIEAGERFAR